MSYAIFAVTQILGILTALNATSKSGKDADDCFAFGGKIMLGGAILACCIKYLFP